MDHISIQKSQRKVNLLLVTKRLKEALNMLEGLVRESHDGNLIDTHYNLEMTYKSLLRYTVEGFSDPERQRIYNQLVVDIFRLSDDAFFSLLTRFGPGVLYEAARKLDRNASVEVADLYQTLRDELDQRQLMESADEPFSNDYNDAFLTLFECLMVKPGVYSKNKELLTFVFTNDSLPWPQQSVLVSALTLHLFCCFNVAAIEFLFSLVSHPNIEVRQRALVGLLLVLYKYDDRLGFYPQVQEQLSKLRDKHITDSLLQTVVIQIARTRETEKLAQKLTDEILPEVARIHPNLRSRLDLDNIIGESNLEGKNPDWEDLFSESPELMNKLEEFSKLQMEGSDLFISTFRMLKHFPFFSRVDNWFLPFTYPSPMVDDILKNESDAFRNPDLIKGMSEAGVLCNSDKFSLILSIPQMPSFQKDMMGKMFMSEMGEVRDVEKSEELVSPQKQALAISNQYIQDLYRFFRLFPKRNSFDDPFSWKLDFHNRSFIKVLFPDSDFYLKMGEYYFNKDRFQEALETFELYNQHNTPAMQLLQKQAYCCQQLKKYPQALDLYLQAELFNHQQVWNLKKIALCYRYLKQPEKALEYYLKSEKLKPDNLHTQVSIGHCLLEVKDYSEALNYYFKVEYLDPKNNRVWRPIAWCALLLGKFEQAEKYSTKVIKDTPSAHDFMNMGHVYWCVGKRQEALEWYQKSVVHPGHSLKEFLTAFTNDQEMLVKHGVDESDIPIMIDQLRYYLES